MGMFDADDDDYAGLWTLHGGPRAPVSHTDVDNLKEELSKSQDTLNGLIKMLLDHQCVLQDPWCACCTKLHKELAEWIGKT